MMMAITATATPLMRKKIRTQLCLSLKTTEIVDSPDRPNIKLNVRKLYGSEDVADTFQWIVTEIKENGVKSPRTLIFCKNKDDTGQINAALFRLLGSNYYTDQTKRHPVIQIFHKDTLDSTKNAIAHDMKKEDGDIRILLATNSAGMGVNFKGFTQVINYGPPRDIDTLVQQLGRVGRLGEKSNAILVYAGKHLRKIEAPVLEYIRTDTCRRKVIKSVYMATEETSNVVFPHECCDICHMSCKCAGDSCPVNSHPACKLPEELSDESKICVRQSTENERALLHQHLEYLKLSILEQSSTDLSRLMAYDLIHGLTASSVDHIVKNCDYITCEDDLLEQYGIFSYDMACAIFKSFSEVFTDVNDVHTTPIEDSD